MKAFARVAVVVGVTLIAVWGTVALAETDKEIRILCGTFQPGEDAAHVLTTLDTGTYLRYRITEPADVRTIAVSSAYDLSNSSCTVTLSEDTVVSSTYRRRVDVARVAAWIAAIGLVGLAVFQGLLAAGAPLGHLAWGGGHRRLPGPLRAASLLAAGFLVCGVVCVLQRAGVIQLQGLPGVADPVVGVLAGLFLLSTLGNAMSTSAAERRVMTPLALVLGCACLLLALGV